MSLSSSLSEACHSQSFFFYSFLACDNTLQSSLFFLWSYTSFQHMSQMSKTYWWTVKCFCTSSFTASHNGTDLNWGKCTWQCEQCYHNPAHHSFFMLCSHMKSWGKKKRERKLSHFLKRYYIFQYTSWKDMMKPVTIFFSKNLYLTFV